MRLRIVTPTRVLAEAEVSELTVPGTAGEFGVLPEHVTFLGAVDTGTLSFVENGETKTIVVEGGYTEVQGEVVTVLADHAEWPEDIDGEQARSQLAEAMKRLEEGSDDPAEVERMLFELRRAQVRATASAR